MARKNNKNLMMGAAFAAGVLGTMTTLLLPQMRNNKMKKGWTSQAKDVASQMMNDIRAWRNSNGKGDSFTRNFLIGSLAGSMVGMTTAMLLAPKSGKDLMQDIIKPFQFNVRAARKGTNMLPFRSSRRPSKRRATTRRTTHRVVRHTPAKKSVYRRTTRRRYHSYR